MVAGAVGAKEKGQNVSVSQSIKKAEVNSFHCTSGRLPYLGQTSTDRCNPLLFVSHGIFCIYQTFPKGRRVFECQGYFGDKIFY
jgi:hypothetical protein